MEDGGKEGAVQTAVSGTLEGSASLPAQKAGIPIRRLSTRTRTVRSCVTLKQGRGQVKESAQWRGYLPIPEPTQRKSLLVVGLTRRCMNYHDQPTISAVCKRTGQPDLLPEQAIELSRAQQFQQDASSPGLEQWCACLRPEISLLCTVLPYLLILCVSAMYVSSMVEHQSVNRK